MIVLSAATLRPAPTTVVSVGVGEVVSTGDASTQCDVLTEDRATSPVQCVDSLVPPSVTFLSGYPPVRSSSPFLEDLGTSGLSAILDVAQPGPSSGGVLFGDHALISSPLHPATVSNPPATAAVLQAASGPPMVASANDESIVFSGKLNILQDHVIHCL